VKRIAVVVALALVTVACAPTDAKDEAEALFSSELVSLCGDFGAYVGVVGEIAQRAHEQGTLISSSVDIRYDWESDVNKWASHYVEFDIRIGGNATVPDVYAYSDSSTSSTTLLIARCSALTRLMERMKLTELPAADPQIAEVADGAYAIAALTATELSNVIFEIRVYAFSTELHLGIDNIRSEFWIPYDPESDSVNIKVTGDSLSDAFDSLCTAAEKRIGAVEACA